MTHSRQPLATLKPLDELLQRQPLPVPEPTSLEWSSRFEQTMQRVRALPTPSRTDNPLDHDSEDALRTPLPVESGEPEPSDPYAFESEKAATYDWLRAPLKSGEHAPVRLATHGASPATTAAMRPTVAKGRLFFLSGAVATFAAAAVAVLWLHSSDDSARIGTAQVQPETVKPHTAPATETAKGVAVVATLQPKDLAPEKNLEKSAALPAETAIATHSGAPSSRGHSPLAPAPGANAIEASNEPELVPAAGPENLVDHPSTGAISAALSRRIPEAQQCLPATLQSTGAHLVFQSNGVVKKVEFSNPELDSGARACLTRALGTVRLEPFARAQFDVNATISRPVASKAGSK